jgi:hypothetical protein
VLACGLWRMAKAARHGPLRASGVGVARIKWGKDTRLSTFVAGSVRNPQGMDRANNPCVTEARPLTYCAMHGWLTS